MPFAMPRSAATPHTPLVDHPDAARLYMPRLSLASCMRCVMVRNTMGLNLTDRQRYSYYPASPVCSITFLLSGDGVEVMPGPDGFDKGPHRALRSRILFSGPYTRPGVTYACGPGHGLMLLLLPDALATLTGIDPGAYLSQTVPATEVLPPAWLAQCESIFAAPNDAQRVATIEAWLAPLWQATRPGNTLHSHLVEDWSIGLAMRAANSGLGRSARQIERRIKQWTGQPLRELRGLGRAERAFFDSLLTGESGNLSWSALATDAGYADQSHLCRQVRRITGFAPERLRHLIAHEEAFWSYRLWGFSHVRQAR
jgi:AraC-like DNA-binding protein